MNLAKNIRSYRQKNNLTQEELAKKLNISRQSISKWEGGKATPTVENIVMLSHILAMPLDQFIKDMNTLVLPSVFGKPKSLYPIILWLFIPILLVIVSIIDYSTASIIPICFGLLLLGFIYAGGVYDFRRYYTYFTVDFSGIHYSLDKPRVPSFPLLTIIKSAFNHRKEKTIPFSEIDSVEILFDTKGFIGWGTVVAYRPRQMYTARENISLKITSKKNKAIFLNLDSLFYPDSIERMNLYPLMKYLSSKDIKIYDRSGLLKSFKEGLNFIEQAYAKNMYDSSNIDVLKN